MEDEKKPAGEGEPDTTPQKEEEKKEDADIEVALKDEITRGKAKERIDEKEEEPQDEEKPLTKKELGKFLSEHEDKIRKELRGEQAKEIASSLAENPKEAELVLEVWKNRRLAGSLRQQLEEAHAIANSKRLVAQNAELKRALAGEDGVIITGENAERKPAPKDAPNLNPLDKQVLVGYIWDNAKGAFRKTIASGRKVFFVSRDMKKRWTEDAPKK